ncbi:MAG: hypothetical protein WBD58_15785 [Geitlerinemataceae cyanobacterium]
MSDNYPKYRPTPEEIRIAKLVRLFLEFAVYFDDEFVKTFILLKSKVSFWI